MIVHWLHLAKGSPDLRDVNSHDLLLVVVEDWTEIEWVLILAVIDVGSVVHQCLLKTDEIAVPVVVADGPRVAVDLVHVRFGDATKLALLDDAGVCSADVLNGLELLHCDLNGDAEHDGI